MLLARCINAELHDWMIACHRWLRVFFLAILGTIRNDQERFADFG